MSDNILALDQATRITGYSVFQNQELKEYGRISPKDQDINKRFVFIKNSVKKLIEKFNITKVYFEDIQLQGNVGNNVKTFKSLAQLQGVLIVLLEELNIPYEIVHSQVWKSSVGIKGKNRTEQKKKAQQYVLENYNIKATQDEADAVCIGTYGVNSIGFDWSD